MSNTGETRILERGDDKLLLSCDPRYAGTRGPPPAILLDEYTHHSLLAIVIYAATESANCCGVGENGYIG